MEEKLKLFRFKENSITMIGINSWLVGLLWDTKIIQFFKTMSL